MRASPSSDMMDDSNLNGTSNGNSSSDDEVVVGEDDELESKISASGSSSPNAKDFYGFNTISNKGSESFAETKNSITPGDSAFFPFETPDSDDPFGEDRPLPQWVAWGETSDFKVGGSTVNPFDDPIDINSNLAKSAKASSPPVPPSSSDDYISNGTTSTSIDSSESSSKSDSSDKGAAVPSLFEEDVEFVGVELEGTEKAMEQALREGSVGEAGPMKRNTVSKKTDKEDSENDGVVMTEFSDSNYWKVEHEVAVLE